MARLNLENHAHEKTVKILQGFSFKIEDVILMMPDRRPEVKSVDAVNTFDAAPLRKIVLAGEVLKKSRVCPPS